MGKVTVSVPLLVVIAYLLQGITGQCSTKGINGIVGCECNIMEACDDQGKPRPNWAQYLPTGVEKFGLVEGGKQNLAYLCEYGTVAILYDCNSRIPLYAATVISGAQLSAGDPGDRPDISFRGSEQQNGLNRYFQQKNTDYARSSERELCYKTDANDYKIDNEWLRSVKVNRNKRPRSDVCPGGSPGLKTEINKGHLIASQYGYGNKERMKATFTYTNAVPQFGSFNKGAWQICEGSLITWGKGNCAVEGAQMFIVVGAIPSTNFGQDTRYFGKEGFSNYKHDVEYPVNVPKYMWTAACCKYTVNGTLKYNSTAFWRQNDPGTAPCNKLDVDWLSRWLSRSRVNLFPHTPQCNDKNNFIRLP